MPTRTLLVGVLSMFDRFIEEGVTPTQHLTLVTLICQDLEIGPSDAFDGYFTDSVLDTLRSLKDPCLHFLGSFITGMDAQAVALATNMRTWKESWIRIAIHVMKHPVSRSQYLLKYQASIWPMIGSREEGFPSGMYRDPESLSHLIRIFGYNVPCSHHLDGEAHILLHLFDKIPSLIIWFDKPAQTSIPLSGRTMNALLTLLVAPNGFHQPAVDALLVHMDRKCLIQLFDIIETVKLSQFALLSILTDICVRLLDDDDRHIICSEEPAAIALCVERALKLPQDYRSVTVIQSLIQRIWKVEGRMQYRRVRTPSENASASAETAAAVAHLLAHLARISVYGSRNSSKLSCARSGGNASPAVGWLPIYCD